MHRTTRFAALLLALPLALAGCWLGRLAADPLRRPESGPFKGWRDLVHVGAKVVSV